MASIFQSFPRGSRLHGIKMLLPQGPRARGVAELRLSFHVRDYVVRQLVLLLHHLLGHFSTGVCAFSRRSKIRGAGDIQRSGFGMVQCSIQDNVHSGHLGMRWYRHIQFPTQTDVNTNPFCSPYKPNIWTQLSVLSEPIFQSGKWG